jgi:DNA polymerase-3 subunit gamma/tau
MDNFIVSARKYRPATFASVVGQGHITSTLRNAISRGHLAHAYLFCGPRGVGKTTCARIFAKAINCMNPGEAEACGECESCRSFEEGRSFNIHELDAASNNSVDDIRNLTDQVRVPPQIGRYSVYIIDEVHMLSAAAFNAFLKTLEEPPAHAIFILATTEKHKIIPTILSRCQIFDFNRIKVEDGVEYMRHIADKEGVTYDEESLNLIARKADGAMRDALSMFDKAVSFCGNNLKYKEVASSLNILDYDTYFDVVDIILSGDYGRALLMFDGVLGQGFSGQLFMSGLNGHLRDLLVAGNDSTAGLLDVTRPLLERYRQQAARCDTRFLFDAIALLTDLDGRVRTATNQRLMVELALMKLCNMASPEAEKKKFDGIAPSAELPPLNHNVARPNAEATAPIVAAAKEPTEAPAKKPEPASQPSEPTPRPATPQPPRPKIASPFAGITGRPLSEIMNGPAAKEQAKEGSAEPLTPVDDEAQAKIERFRDKFIAKLAGVRPRLGVVYETMEAEGNHVKVRVASEALSDEVLRHRTETLSLLATVAGIHGPIELDVTVDETLKASKPIKIEDKIAYLAERNAAFDQLRRTLDMDIE